MTLEKNWIQSFGLLICFQDVKLNNARMVKIFSLDGNRNIIQRLKM